MVFRFAKVVILIKTFNNYEHRKKDFINKIDYNANFNII